MNTTMTNDLVLYCEYLKTPLGLQTQTPRFSWKGTGCLQTALQLSYRLQVWDAGCLTWDSGEVYSAQSSAVRYGGPELRPASRYFWRVTVTVQDGGSYANESWFETGLLQPEDWKGSPLFFPWLWGSPCFPWWGRIMEPDSIPGSGSAFIFPWPLPGSFC